MPTIASFTPARFPASAAAVLLDPPSGMVTLFTETGDQLTLILIGDPDFSGGVGGWQSSERAADVDVDWYKAPTKPTGSLPCALHLAESPGWTSLERRLAVLRAMGKPDGPSDPPAVRLTGDVPPHAKRRRWKLDDISYGARRFRADKPNALEYQEVTLSLSGFDRAGEVEDVSVSRSRMKNGKRRRRSYTVRRGDTLRSIAVRELGASSEWTEIREANKKLKKQDPDEPLRAGLTIKLG